jgi:biopolymer transport protein TolR
MGISVCGAKRGALTEMNVVPLVDILLVLLVIFMVIPNSRGTQVQVPQSSDPQPRPSPEVVAVQVLANGTLKLNQQTVSRTGLRERLQEALRFRAERVAFVLAARIRWSSRPLPRSLTTCVLLAYRLSVC